MSASASYQLANGRLASCSLHTTSPVFTIYASLKDSATTRLTNSRYDLKVGFAGAVYFSALGPIVTSITPASAYNLASITGVKIAGANFSANPTVSLRATGEANILAGNQTVTRSEIDCDFDLRGAKVGFWNVVVENSSTETASLNNAFEIKSYSYEQSVIINSPNPFDPARETTVIIYRLPEDKNVTVVIYTTTAELIWKRDYVSGSNGGRAGENNFSWDGLSDPGNLASNGVYLIHVIDRGSGRTLARGKIAVIRR